MCSAAIFFMTYFTWLGEGSTYPPVDLLLILRDGTFFHTMIWQGQLWAALDDIVYN